MPTTSNFGWTTPADTDLVKDGAAAIRTLGNGIDTSFVDLKGGTTGQVLSKTSNTDMDFTWINNDQGDITAVTAGTGLTGGGTTGAVTLTNDMATTITASGDIIVGTGSGTYDNLPIGTTGQVLTADTTVSPYKVKWATAGGGGLTWTLLNSGGTALTGAATITVSGISDKEYILIIVDQASSANAGATIAIRINTDTGSNYRYWGAAFEGASSYSSNVFKHIDDNPQTYNRLAKMSNNAGSTVIGGAFITGGKSTGIKTIQASGGATAATGSANTAYVLNGVYEGTAAITSISIFSDSGNFDAGTVYVYGA